MFLGVFIAALFTAHTQTEQVDVPVNNDFIKVDLDFVAAVNAGERAEKAM